MAEPQPSFDAAKYKNAQREQWNKDGAAWRPEGAIYQSITVEGRSSTPRFQPDVAEQDA